MKSMGMFILSILLIIFIWAGALFRIRRYFCQRADTELGKLSKESGKVTEYGHKFSYYYYLSSKNVIDNIFFFGLKEAVKPAFKVFTFIVNILLVLSVGCGIWAAICTDSFAASLCYRILCVLFEISIVIRFFLTNVKYDKDLLLL